MNFFSMCSDCVAGLAEGKIVQKRRRSLISLRALAAVLVLLVSWHPRASSQRFFSKTRNRRSLSSTTRPVSYKSQFFSPTTTTSADDYDSFYKKRGYRPWRVDFTPRSPGHYSWTSRIVMTNVFMYMSQIFFPAITQQGIKLSEPILQGRQLWRLATPMFLHGGLPHLLANIYSLQAVGNDVERYFGPGRYIFTYLMSGVVANFVSAIKTPNPSLGASGAVFGIVGAYYVFLNRNMVSRMARKVWITSVLKLTFLVCGMLSRMYLGDGVKQWQAPLVEQS